MMKKVSPIRFLAYLLVIAASMIVTACGGGGGDGSPPPGETLDSIVVSPDGETIATGGSIQFTATAYYSDGSTEDITYYVAWESDNTSIATIDASGVATGAATGDVWIRASMDGVDSDYVTLTVRGSRTIYVNAATGNDDTADGTLNLPYRTITNALWYQSPDPGDIVSVAPGTYNEALGETFPILLPQGVSLIGDEGTQGGSTFIRGTGLYTAPNNLEYNCTIFPGANSVIAGFSIWFDTGNRIVLYHNNVTVRWNNIGSGNRNTADAGIFVVNSSQNHLITRNYVHDHTIGLYFQNAGPSTKVEYNDFWWNTHGIAYRSQGGDLGGGPTGSAGGNGIRRNYDTDLYVNATGITVWALSNTWDQLPPRYSTTDATNYMDIYNAGGTADIRYP